MLSWNITGSGESSRGDDITIFPYALDKRKHHQLQVPKPGQHVVEIRLRAARVRHGHVIDELPQSRCALHDLAEELLPMTVVLLQPRLWVLGCTDNVNVIVEHQSVADFDREIMLQNMEMAKLYRQSYEEAGDERDGALPTTAFSR